MLGVRGIRKSPWPFRTPTRCGIGARIRNNPPPSVLVFVVSIIFRGGLKPIFGKSAMRKTHIQIRHFTRPSRPISDLPGDNSDPMEIRPNDGAAELPKYPTFRIAMNFTNDIARKWLPEMQITTRNWIYIYAKSAAFWRSGPEFPAAGNSKQ